MLSVLLLTLAASSPPWATRAILPVDERDPGLAELLDDGEVVLVQDQAASSFKGLMVTRAPETCAIVEDRMLDVRGYPKLWNKRIKKVEVIERTETDIHYALYLDVFLSPRLEARIKNPERGKVIYWSKDTPSLFTWNLEQHETSCVLFYEMYHPEGVRSDFVVLVNKLEPGINDAGEVAAALVSSRGYSSPEKPGKRDLGPRALATYDALSGASTALRVVRRGKELPLYVVRRRVPVPVDVVRARIRDKAAFEERIDFLHDVEQKDAATTWELRAFGGEVTFTTTASERRGDAGSFVIEETVTTGDIRRGRWTWVLTPIAGGTAVELHVDLDVTSGSRVLKTLASQDQLIRDSTSLQLVYEFMRIAAPEKALPVSDGVLAGRPRSDTARGAN